MALPKRNRLSLRTSKDLFLDNRRYYSTHFSIAKSAQTKENSAQFAIVVSKKVARLSHDRHKIRRLTSSVIYDLVNKFPFGYYLVFPKNTVLTVPFTDLIADLSTITTKM